MTFSIIVVCLNAGEKLRETIDSILHQTWQDYEIIIKDGGSTEEVTRKYLDGYAKACETKHGQLGEESAAKLRVYSSKDTGIYDAMNQAVEYVCGDYVLFLNCGDSFYDMHVLERVSGKIRKQVQNRETGGCETDREKALRSEPSRYIFYGNIYERLTGTQVQSNPVIDDFACYRNVPCHQACFYEAALLREKPFDTAYAVRADYEHFLWCYYRAHVKTVYMPVTVALYEGGGFSETKENERRSRREHREIVNRYMPAAKVRKYRLIMAVTLAPVRTWIAKNPVTAGIYQKVKKVLYTG
ncbi:MAG: glycosyltransferase [Lachnospiraceae bacterium]|nr:glycosyltransferase [Lachnospiraceae bacterium]